MPQLTISPKYSQFASLGKQVLNLIHHFQAYDLAFDEGERFFIEDDDIVTDLMKLLTAKNSAGFDRMAALYFNEDRSFSGVVEDFISIRLTKRYAFRANDTTLQYRLINPVDVENFSEAEVWEFASKKAGKKKQAKCVKGVPCEPICLRASYVCLHDFNEQQKKILKSAQAKALKLKAKAELKGEKVIDYDINRSDSQAATKLGQQFIANYISTSQPSARELELEKRQKEIKKEITKSKKEGKYNPKELEAEAIEVAEEYKKIKQERTTRLEDELFVLRKALIAHHGVPDGVLDQLTDRLKFEATVPEAKVDKIKDDLKGFYALTGSAGHDNLKTIEVSGKLASSDLAQGRLNVGGYVTDDRLWNQAARHWEAGSTELNKAATQWRDSRAENPNPVKLNSLVKNGTYAEDELGLKGNYLDPYLGKVHGGAGSPTEVLAMGLERMSSAKRMAALYKKDPEFLEFLVGSLVANKDTPPVKLEPKPIAKKTEPKPVEPKPTVAKKTEPKPVEPKPTVAKKTEPKPVEPKPTVTKETKPQKAEEIKYKINTSDYKEVINLGEQFTKKYFKYFPPSQEELDAKAQKEKLSKEFSAIQKKGGGAPIELTYQMMEANNKYNELSKKRDQDLRKQLRSLLSAVTEKHGLSESAVNNLLSKVDFTQEATPYQEQVKNTLKTFYLLTNGSGSETIKTIGKDKSRAYANKEKKYVNIGDFFTKEEVLLHEFSHHFEYNNAALNKAARSWRDDRASGPPEKLSVLTKNNSYGDHEIAQPDKFLDPYVGKIYPAGFTEVLSMGIERLSTANSMLKFYETDSQHFHFVLGALLADK